MQDKSIDLSADYWNRFGGIAKVYGHSLLHTLAQSHVCIIGLGGVGVWTAEALARSGVGQLTLIDLDEICITNVNRQLHAMSSSVGQAKVDIMAQRIADIAPECQVNVIQEFFTLKTADRLLEPAFDCVIDAIDHTRRKAHLIYQCYQKEMPIVVSGAAAGLVNPALIKYDDLSLSTHDGLLRWVKKILRKEYGLSRETVWNIPAVFSKEQPVYPTPEGGLCRSLGPRKSGRIDCNDGLGTVSFVTGSFGLMCAHLAIEQIKRTTQS